MSTTLARPTAQQSSLSAKCTYTADCTEISCCDTRCSWDTMIRLWEQVFGMVMCRNTTRSLQHTLHDCAPTWETGPKARNPARDGTWLVDSTMWSLAFIAALPNSGTSEMPSCCAASFKPSRCRSTPWPYGVPMSAVWRGHTLREYTYTIQLCVQNSLRRGNVKNTTPPSLPLKLSKYHKPQATSLPSPQGCR